MDKPTPDTERQCPVYKARMDELWDATSPTKERRVSNKYKFAREVVDSLIQDLSERNGYGQWGDEEDHIINMIKKEWEVIVVKKLYEYEDGYMGKAPRDGRRMSLLIPYSPRPQWDVGYWCDKDECFRYDGDDGPNDIQPIKWTRP